MEDKKSVLGIDLGTSSVKVLQRYADGTVIKSKRSYKETGTAAWWDAVCKALSEATLQDVEAIGLSSQVGTYIIDGQDVIRWDCGIGAEELAQMKKQYSRELFLKEISMPHPNIASYPIPRLKYIREHYPDVKKVCQPKDFICERLTGNWVTDPYSWRGLANLETKKYSTYFLDAIGLTKEHLPEMIGDTTLAGYTRERALCTEDEESGGADTGGAQKKHGNVMLPAGIPVYVGLNDYYASLLGMGIQNVGDMFDISGTSEHLGIIERSVNVDTKLVSGPYVHDNVHYGVTASSGASLDFGLQFCENRKIALEAEKKRNPPIFLPYLNGERAPIWDADARGMFFGVSAGCSKEDMAYAVMEGVVFSLYHIYESMGKPDAAMMRIAGGAAVNPVLNQLKAEMFGIPAAVMEEKDTSALGAAMVAAVGAGWYADFGEAAADLCKIRERIEPDGTYREWLEKRFSIYKKLYPAVKGQYEALRRIGECNV